MGKQWTHGWLYFSGSKISANGDSSPEIKRHLLLGRKVMINLDSTIKSFANKGPSSQAYGFSSGHVWMWELDYKEGRVPKNWCFWTVVLEKTLESLLDCKEIQPVHPKGDQSWVSIGETDVETPVFWSSDANSWSLEKSWCWERLSAEGKKRSSEDKMDGYHHWCNRHQLGQTSGDGEGQGGLLFCSR